MRSFPSQHFLVLLLLICCLFGCYNPDFKDQKIKLLILSGSNNHDWQQTTPVLRTIFDENGLFTTDLTNNPDTLNYSYLCQYDVVVSNWNSWPDNDLRWSKEAEEGLIRYLNEGGGLVFFHSSTSVFYQWPEFQDISTAAWVEQTHHGAKCPVFVSIDNQDHPITKGLSDFYIFDELWIDAAHNKSFQVLGNASRADPLEEDNRKQPAIFVADYGAGRIFHTILGHDARAMRNTGFRTLLLRASMWVAKRRIEADIPQEILRYDSKEESNYSWLENDTTFGLLNNNKIVWQYNFNTRYGKPFFHPLYLNRSRITCLSPDDHLWHLGQWFSWKYINRINYWEYVGRGYRSEGVTDITEIEKTKYPDFSADIWLEIDYHPQNEATVLKEKRSIHISPPEEDEIRMEYSLLLESPVSRVDLDRTPISGEPDGKSWGGYAGLSLRFNQDLMSPVWTTENGNMVDVNGTTGSWLYMGFKGFDGRRIGSAVFISDKTRRKGEAWYLINNPEPPFFYFSPAYLYLKPLTLHQGEKLHLNYMVLHISGDVTQEMLESEYLQYIHRTQ